MPHYETCCIYVWTYVLFQFQENVLVVSVDQFLVLETHAVRIAFYFDFLYPAVS